ncbi:hypothetical protein [Polaribacter sp. Z022]|uniref:hypothetical protein n=1 Tax=Polaribacter sp. Z022 TaxID=2927125 RepID=UPI002022766D|nr:hypothetical protein [Polaribacter sp. Z022]MCL7755131.1 hypothetical protein [Polaribacter sp. Z022]
MRKNLIFTLLFIIIQSCQSEFLMDNKNIIEKIDKLDFSKTIFEVSIDKNENIIDTLSVVKIKTNKNGKIVYKQKEYLPKASGNIIQQSYFRNNKDLFYQETSANKEFKSIFETFVNKENVIYKARTISYETENQNDTILMTFEYKYDIGGKKETLFIKPELDSISSLDFTKYNKNEKPEFGYLIIENDTVQKRKINYLNGKMIESTYEFKKPFRTIISTFNNNEKTLTEILFIKINDTIKKASESIFEYNENSELIITKDILNDTITKRKKITVHNNVQN